MALDDISFTNDLGTITFKRALMDVSDEWQWNGRKAVHHKRITVEGMMTRDPSEALHGVLTRRQSSSTNVGHSGSLKLPWTTLTNMKLEGIEMPSGGGGGGGGWQVMAPVTASFLDDTPDHNRYVMTYFGMALHNPRLSLPIPAKSTIDQYAQIQDQSQGEVLPSNPYYGPIRFRPGYSMMQVNLSGTMILTEGCLPENMFGLVQQRIGVGGVDGDLPDGFPKTFRLGEAVPEVAADLALTQCFVVNGRITWNVEEQTAKLSILMMAQPQAWAEV